MTRQWRSGRRSRRTATVVGNRPWRGRDRGHHQLHEYEQSVASCSPPACSRRKRWRRGCTVPPYVKTSLAPGSRVVTDYLDKSGLTEPLRAARLSHGWLWLHDLHRQQRSAARCRGQGGDGGRSGRFGGALRQSQFRRPRQSAREGELPRQPAAGRRVCPGRHDRYRPDQRADRPGNRRQRCFSKTSGRPHAEVQASRRRVRAAGDVQRAVFRRLRQQPRRGTRSKSPKGICIAWNQASTYIQEPPFLADLQSKRCRSSRSSAPACWRCWATR